jgi:hypothetical protein
MFPSTLEDDPVPLQRRSYSGRLLSKFVFLPPRKRTILSASLTRNPGLLAPQLPWHLKEAYILPVSGTDALDPGALPRT